MAKSLKLWDFSWQEWFWINNCDKMAGERGEGDPLAQKQTRSRCPFSLENRDDRPHFYVSEQEEAICIRLSPFSLYRLVWHWRLGERDEALKQWPLFQETLLILE